MKKIMKFLDVIYYNFSIWRICDIISAFPLKL